MLHLRYEFGDVGHELVRVDIVDEVDVDLMLAEHSESLAVFGILDVFNYLFKHDYSRIYALKVATGDLQDGASTIDCNNTGASLDCTDIEIRVVLQRGQFRGFCACLCIDGLGKCTVGVVNEELMRETRGGIDKSKECLRETETCALV